MMVSDVNDVDEEIGQLIKIITKDEYKNDKYENDPVLLAARVLERLSQEYNFSLMSLLGLQEYARRYADKVICYAHWQLI